MTEVARMWNGLLSDKRPYTHKDASQAEIEQGAAQQAQQPKSGLDSETLYQDYSEQILSPRSAVDTSKRSSTPLLSRRGSPLPHNPSSEIHAKDTKISPKPREDISELVHRTTPVVEFIEYYRNRIKAKKRRGKIHRRRYSEPVQLEKSKGILRLYFFYSSYSIRIKERVAEVLMRIYLALQQLDIWTLQGQWENRLL
jgi:hypothetical protein